MKRDRYKTSIAFIDLLFNITIGLAMLFIISFLLINPITKKGDIEYKAEFMITLSWPSTSYDDIDLYVMDPAKNIVHYRNKDAGLTNLDRDDLGKSNDTITTEAGTFENTLNEEHVTIRGILPGEYIVNAHWFSKSNTKVGKKGEQYVPSDSIKVSIKIEKLNPYVLIYTGDEVISAPGLEVTFLRFYVDEKGNVTKTNKLNYPIVIKSNEGHTP